MFKVRKSNYKALKALSMRQRMEAAQSNDGKNLLLVLTPTQLAALFPDYYRRQLPDIGGFMKALTTHQTQKRQKELDAQIEKSATAAAQRNMEQGGWRKKWQEGMTADIGGKPKYMLSDEDKANYESLKNGPISIDDPRMSKFASLTEQQLAEIGVKKIYNDQLGKAMFKYEAPVPTEEQVKEYAKNVASGSGTSIANRLAFYRQYAVSKGVDPDLVTGIVMREGGQTRNRMERWSNNDPSLSGQPGTAYGDFQLNVGTTVHRMGNDYLKLGIPMDAAHWKEQGKFAIDQIAAGRTHEWMSVKNNGGIGAISAIGASEWASKRGSVSNATPDYSQHGLEAAREAWISEQTSKRIGSLARMFGAQPERQNVPIAEQGAAFTAKGNLEGVDPRLVEIMKAASSHLPKGYQVVATSGVRGNNPSSQHYGGKAADFQIIDPDGNVISNRGPDTTGRYRELARHAYGEMMSRYPDLKNNFVWGGAFETSKGSGEADLMHFDLGPQRGRYAENRIETIGAFENEKYGTEYAEAKTKADQPTNVASLSKTPEQQKALEPNKEQVNTEPTPKPEPVPQQYTPNTKVAQNAPVAPPQPEPQVEEPPKKKKKKGTVVASRDKGGQIKLSTEKATIRTVNKTNDNVAVVDNKVEGTFNTNEAHIYDPKTKTMEVIPQKKLEGTVKPNKEPGQPEKVKQEIEDRINQIETRLKENKTPKLPTNRMTEEPMDKAFLNDLSHQSGHSFNNPAVERAHSRVHGIELGHPTTEKHNSQEGSLYK